MLLALVGLILVLFSGTLITAMIGAVAWGLGAALGFPVGMSAAGDDPRYAASRVSTVASIGYTAFLTGPPLIGFLGNHFGVLHSLTVAAGLLALAAVIAGACRPLVPEDRRPQPRRNLTLPFPPGTAARSAPNQSFARVGTLQGISNRLGHGVPVVSRKRDRPADAYRDRYLNDAGLAPGDFDDIVERYRGMLAAMGHQFRLTPENGRTQPSRPGSAFPQRRADPQS